MGDVSQTEQQIGLVREDADPGWLILLDQKPSYHCQGLRNPFDTLARFPYATFLATQKENGQHLRLCTRTNISSAENGFDSVPVENDALARVGPLGWSRNGFRDTGRGGGSSKGDAVSAGFESLADDGEAARLRKGLFDERIDKWPVIVKLR